MKMIGIILLWILKCVGWLLLGIIALILLVLLILLFVPVRYRLQFSNTGDMQGKVVATWLLHLVRVEAVWQEKKLKFTYRVLWFRKKSEEEKLNQQQNKKPKQKKKDSKAQEKTEKQPVVTAERVEKEKTRQEQTEQIELVEPAEEAAESIEPNQSDIPLEEPETMDFESESEESEEKKQSILDKLKQILKTVQSKVEQIRDKVQQILGKIEDARKKGVSLVDQVVYYPGRDAILKLFTGQLGYIIGRFRPRRLTLSLIFGFEDPSTTGQCMAAYGVLSALYMGEIKNYRIQIEPDFENKRLEAELTAKGRIALYVVILAVIRLWRDKKIRKLIQDIKNARR